MTGYAVGPFATLPNSNGLMGAYQRQTNAQRALQAWHDLGAGKQDGKDLATKETGLFQTEVNNGDIAHVWPMSQAHAAALNLGAVTGDFAPAQAIDGQMQRYLANGAYQPSIDNGPGKDRYTDDNMAQGLNHIQSYMSTGNPTDLKKAKDLFPFFEKMMDPNGGLNWREGSKAYVADSVAGAQKYALLLMRASTDPAEQRKYWDFSQKLDRFTETRLRVTDPKDPKYGLLIDNVESNNETAKWSKNIFSYNQGWSVGSDVERFKITGDERFLNRAHRTATKTLEYYATTENGNGLWKQPPSFNANFFENLLALEAVDPRPSGGKARPYEHALRTYLDRAWKEARDPESGHFFKGGIGSFTGYGPNKEAPKRVDMIDQAGMVQMYSLLAMTEQQREVAV